MLRSVRKSDDIPRIPEYPTGIVRHPPRRSGGAGQMLNNSAGVTIENLKVTDPRSDTTAAVEILPSVEVGRDQVKIDGIEAVLHSDSVEVRDNRPGGQ